MCGWQVWRDCGWHGILPEWSKGADLRSARHTSAWVQTPQVPSSEQHRVLAHTDAMLCQCATKALCQFFLFFSFFSLFFFPVPSANKSFHLSFIAHTTTFPPSHFAPFITVLVLFGVRSHFLFGSVYCTQKETRFSSYIILRALSNMKQLNMYQKGPFAVHFN